MKVLPRLRWPPRRCRYRDADVSAKRSLLRVLVRETWERPPAPDPRTAPLRAHPLDLRRLQLREHLGAPRLDDWRGRHHLHGRIDRRGLQDDRDVERLADLKRQVDVGRRKTGDLDRQTIVAHRKIEEPETSTIVGDRLPRPIRVRASHLYRRAGNDRLARVADGAGHARGGDRLRPGRRRRTKYESHRRRHGEPSSKIHDCTPSDVVVQAFEARHVRGIEVPHHDMFSSAERKRDATGGEGESRDARPAQSRAPQEAGPIGPKSRWARRPVPAATDRQRRRAAGAPRATRRTY